jgi:hypothetical protein
LALSLLRFVSQKTLQWCHEQGRDILMKLVYKKTAIIFLSIMAFSIAAFLSIGYNHKNSPPKIINPHDPRFVVEDFRWDDYRSAKELADVFKIIFPAGTEKTYIDQILLAQPESTASEEINIDSYKKKTGGKLASTSDEKILNSDPNFKNAKTFVKYNHPMEAPIINFAPSTSWTTTVYYDDQKRVVNIMVYTFVVH